MIPAIPFLIGLPDDRFDGILQDPKAPALIKHHCGEARGWAGAHTK